MVYLDIKKLIFNFIPFKKNKNGSNLTEISENYHKLELVDLEKEFNTSIKSGLSTERASELLSLYGKNKLNPKKPNPFLKIIKYFFTGFCGLIWIAAIICILAWKPIGEPNSDPVNLGLGILLILVILLQAAFSAFQDWSSSKVMKSIKNMMPSSACVIRNGKEHDVPVENLVIGDLILLSFGKKVPADVRIIESHDLKFDKSMLTGESEAVDGVIECTDDRYVESKNVAFMTTLVTNGQGKGIIIATGGKTVIGKIANLTSQNVSQTTSLQKELKRFVLIVGSAAIIVALIVIIVWVAWLRVKYPNYINTAAFLVNTISVMVAFIPEGLPVCVTLSLLVVAKRMAKSQVLVKNLAVIETLSCVNVIASDKTGTLTQNKMFVSSASVGIDQVDDSEKQIDGFDQLISACSLCNNAHFEVNEENDKLDINQKIAIGDATDIALLRYSSRYSIENIYDILAEIPFNSRNKWMLKVIKPLKTSAVFNQETVLIKGAPDYLIKKSSHILNGNIETHLNDSIRSELTRIQNDWSSKGKRVLVICKRSIDSKYLNVNDLEKYINETNDLCVIGLVGIIDPPREGISDVVTKCKEAGIRVMMVTGDYALTAAAIAEQIGIFSKNDYATRETMSHQSVDKGLLLSGSDLEDLTEEEWRLVTKYKEIVLARTTPEQKLKTVKEFQKDKFIVAVTGDGVNDAPALKSADVGIAMGGGSEVAMEASQLVLLDNNFSSILIAIRNGRLVFRNLKKVILFLLPGGCFAELIPVLMSFFLGVQQNISSFKMLVISLFTDIAPSLSLMMEKEETDLLKQPPRSRNEHLVDYKFLIQAYLFLGVFVVLSSQSMFFIYMYTYSGLSPAQIFLSFDKLPEIYNATSTFIPKNNMTRIETAKMEVQEFYFNGQTVTFVSIVMLQIFGNLLATRTNRNSIFQQNIWKKKTRNLYLIGAQFISFAIMILVVYVPIFHNFFNSRPLPVQFLFLPLIFSFFLVLIDEIRKLLVRKKIGFFHKIAW